MGSRPFSCGENPDVNIFRSKMKERLAVNERVVADQAHPDSKCISQGKMNEDLIDSIRAKDEKANGSLKFFKVLCDRFRHPHDLHSK